MRFFRFPCKERLPESAIIFDPMPLHVLGISHQSASLEIREKLAFPTESQGEALSELAAQPGVAEAVLVSTCNRTEIYCRADDVAAARAWLVQAGARSGVDIGALLYCHSEDDAVRHAFRVASGLDSMVLGEPQILGQVKQSVRNAQNAGTLGSLLGHLFQQTFSVAKQVRTETALGAQSISMAAAALKLAQNLFGDLSRSRLLLVGVGEMVEIAASYFVAQQPQAVVVANRTLARGEEFAERFNARDEGAQLTLDEVAEACRLAHERGRRIYLTLNILTKPSELMDALVFLGDAIDRGVDAAIVQDIGLVRLIQRVYPGFEIHGSTQMTVHDASGARVMRELGIDRVADRGQRQGIGGRRQQQDR